MLALQPHHITDLYCFVDDSVPKVTRHKGGRPAALCYSEVITILLWNTLTMKQKTLKDIYHWVSFYHRHDFPTLPPYNRFVDHCHRALPVLLRLLNETLVSDAPLKFIDSTMLEVCKLVRAESHKTAKNIASLGKNHQGWHYGFKLHLSIDIQGKLGSCVFTPAHVHDAQVMPKLLNAQTRVAVGDSHYGARVMGRAMWQRYGTIIIAPPHYKQRKKLMTPWQHALLKARPKIESVFDYLKEHLHLVSSFPRSVMGYLLHYARILLGYQILRG